MHGPQAPHEDTSQWVGQGIWHSWDLLGTAPWHSLFSTGREAVQMSQEGTQNKKQIKRNLLYFDPVLVCLYVRNFFTSVTTNGNKGYLIYFCSWQESPYREQMRTTEEENRTKQNMSVK